MWPLKKKDPVKLFGEDCDKLSKMYVEIIRGAVANVGGKVDQALSQQFVDQYLTCHSRHGEHFLKLTREIYISAWMEDTDKRKESLNRMHMFLAEVQLVTLLMGTHQCPEMDEVYHHMLMVAKQV